MLTNDYYQIQQNLFLSKDTLKQWDDIFVPDYDFFYFDNTEDPRRLLSPEVLIYSRDELGDDKRLSNLNITTAFMPWNVDKTANYVAVVPNAHFQNISHENRIRVFYEQWRLGRGQIWEYTWLSSALDEISETERDAALKLFETNTFDTPNGKMVANQRTIWQALPEEARTAILISIAKMFSHNPSLWSELTDIERNRLTHNHAGLIPHFNSFGLSNGPNCFATALAGATNDPIAVEWVIDQWIQPKETLLLSLAQRGYVKYDSGVSEQSVEGDVLVWVNNSDVPLHACYVLGNGLVFNKNSQLMFSPRQVTYEKDIRDSWKHVIEEGGALHIYRTKG